MGLTRYPHGISSFGVPVVGGGAILTTGNIFFVNSSTAGASDDNRGDDPAKPLATIDAAVGKCADDHGDYIIVGPGHAETLDAAGELVFDVDGVTVVGIGHGSARPTITQDATAADIDITGNNVTLRNLVFVAGAADITASIDLDAENAWFDACEWQDAAADENYVDYILGPGDNVADGLKVTNCKAVSPDTGNDGFLNCVGDIDGLVFTGNFIKMGVAANEPVIEVAGKSLTNCLIAHNYIDRQQTAGDIFIASDQTDNSGIIAYNVISHADAASAVPIDLTGAGAFENYATGDADGSGVILPAAANDAA